MNSTELKSFSPITWFQESLIFNSFKKIVCSSPFSLRNFIIISFIILFYYFIKFLLKTKQFKKNCKKYKNASRIELSSINQNP